MLKRIRLIPPVGMTPKNKLNLRNPVIEKFKTNIGPLADEINMGKKIRKSLCPRRNAKMCSVNSIFFNSYLWAPDVVGHC